MDAEACYAAIEARDRRFDGMFYTAVRTDGRLLPARVSGADSAAGELRILRVGGGGVGGGV